LARHLGEAPDLDSLDYSAALRGGGGGGAHEGDKKLSASSAAEGGEGGEGAGEKETGTVEAAVAVVCTGDVDAVGGVVVDTGCGDTV
jgi:hypothetical protein